MLLILFVAFCSFIFLYKHVVSYAFVIVFGGWGNTHTSVTCNSRDQSNYAIWDEKSYSPNVLSRKEFREFHISFANNLLEISPKGGTPILTYPINCPLEVKYIGVASGYGNAGEWIYCGHGKWILLRTAI